MLLVRSAQGVRVSSERHGAGAPLARCGRGETDGTTGQGIPDEAHDVAALAEVATDHVFLLPDAHVVPLDVQARERMTAAPRQLADTVTRLLLG